MESEDGELYSSLDEKNNAPVESREYTIDHVGQDQEPAAISICDVLKLFRPVLTHALGVGSNLALAYDHFSIGQNVNGCQILGIITMSVIAIIFIDSQLKSNSSMEQSPKKDRCWMAFIEIARLAVFYILGFVFQLVRQLRYEQIIRSALKVRQCNSLGDRARSYYEEMRQEQRDLALLNVFNSLLQSAPLLVVRIVSHWKQDTAITNLTWYEILFGCWTLMTLGWTMTCHDCAIRLGQQDKTKICYCRSAVLLLAHSGMIASRVILISIAIFFWPEYTVLGCMFICIGWIIWMTLQDGVLQFCRDENVLPHAQGIRPERMRTVSFAALLAVVYRFTFVKLSEIPERLSLWTHFIQSFLENIVIIMLVYFASSDAAVDRCNLMQYSIIAVVVYSVAFAIYYMFLNFLNRSTFCVVGLGTLCVTNRQLASPHCGQVTDQKSSQFDHRFSLFLEKSLSPTFFDQKVSFVTFFFMTMVLFRFFFVSLIN